MQTPRIRTIGLILAAVWVAVPVAAQQTVNLSLGYFAPKGEDARASGDVLRANREFLSFEVGDFGGASVGGEWLVPIGRFVEGGVGLSFTRRTVPSVYTAFVDNSGREIEQEARLRRVPIDFSVRLLPFGLDVPVQPYIGLGGTAVAWRYAEFGDFVDFDRGRRVFRDEFVASGTRGGVMAVGGIRFAGDSSSAGFELRFHDVEAPLDDRFAGSRLDLGGWTYQFTAGVRF